MSDTEAKTSPASKRKLAKKRSEGAVPAAQDLAGLLAAAAGIVLITATGTVIWGSITQGYSGALSLLNEPFLDALDASIGQLVRSLALAVLPVFGLSLIVAVIVTILYNNGIVFSLKPVVPQLERVSPKSGFKRVYGRRGWIETGAGFSRIALWFLAAGIIAVLWLPGLLKTANCGGPCQAHILLPMTWYLIGAAVVIMLLSAGVDMLLQRFLFLGEQRMTKSEVKREQKEQTGTPEVRRERKRLQREMADGADSIGLGRANMCFYSKDQAVSIRFMPPQSPLPRITAKADGAIEAAKMRAALRKAGFPESERPLIVAKAMSRDIGSVIDQSTYKDFGAAMREMFGNKV